MNVLNALTLQDMLTHLYTDGATTDGVFRKPPKQSAVRQLRERLDRGERVSFTSGSMDITPLVSASLLKEFLRNIPNKLLVNDMYKEWMAVSQMVDASGKCETTKKCATKSSHHY
jgi:hypothetical protein